MDLRQIKLSKQEWESIEKPISDEEKEILNMIDNGYENPKVYFNHHKSLLSFLKFDNNESFHGYLYERYFKPRVEKIHKKYIKNNEIKINTQEKNKLKRLNSADTIRIQHFDETIQNNESRIFEFILIELCYNIMKYISKKKTNYVSYLYTLIHIKKSSIHNINTFIIDFVDKIIEYASPNVKSHDILKNAPLFIEKNEYLMKYSDKTLYSHQKNIYSIFNKKNNSPKLVLYSAPTGTGKTMTPIGLSNTYRIIFVCVARHIGLALAKSAITLGKKIAFAFGCESADDIRLHYFAAKEYTRNYKSGGIYKVDNSEGDNVEIMICDVRSYLISMYYMKNFNNVENIITFWDEPTITLDTEEHELHSIIHKNWSENVIPNMVLSCATLPEEQEIMPVIMDFKMKFGDMTTTYHINSNDFKKSIPLLSKESKCMLPHNMYSEYNDIMKCARFCSTHKTLLRYLDLESIVEFIYYIHENNMIDNDYSIDEYFGNDISKITMMSIKDYYLICLENMEEENWKQVYNALKHGQQYKFPNYNIQRTTSMQDKNSSPIAKSYELKRTTSVFDADVKESKRTGILLTTEDAHTLTDGPTIYLCEDVRKIGSFYLQQSKIPMPEYQSILTKINKNNELSKKIEDLEREIDSREQMNNDDDSKVKYKNHVDNETRKLIIQVDKLRKQVVRTSLDSLYIPNSVPHQEKWVGTVSQSPFKPQISEVHVKRIMLLPVDNTYKALLLLGIGVLLEKDHKEYNEIMKEMAEEQLLFIIIASSDYIYGTNYQFCHGVIGKDLENMTQQKTMQALGRIGRNGIQQEYSVRFRNEDIVYKLFNQVEDNMEANNMNNLFSSDD